MRIANLTDSVTEQILSARRGRESDAERAAGGIVAEVRRRGDAALFEFTRRFDGLRLTPKTLWVSAAEPRTIPRDLREALEHAARNIRRVAEEQRPRSWTINVEPGVKVAQRVSAIETIGCYIPGGRHSLLSTLLMTAIPAQVAGVKRIVVACPKPNAALLAAAEMLGLSEIAHIGGAQAIAALAYGTRSVPRVDKIFGPGNRYVTAAKRIVSAERAVDMLAGPTEVLVLATRGEARFIAADLIAQAEHDTDATALFVTTSRALGAAVSEFVDEQLSLLPPGNPARTALLSNGAILIARDVKSALRFANLFAPEHLSVPSGEEVFAQHLPAAGSVFIGPWAAQSVGDYASGTNHVLPTGGGARSRGGLSTWDFVRCTTVQTLSQAGLRRVAPVVSALADAEGLVAHKRDVEVRK